MELKAEIKARKTYDLTINGIEHRGFTVASEWEGLVKLTNTQGMIILYAPDNPFSFLRNSDVESLCGTLSILRSSLCFMPKDKQEKTDE